MGSTTKAPKKKAKSKKAQKAVDELAERRAKKAAEVRDYRQRTGYEYDKKYKKARAKALSRLAKKYPNAYKRMLAEEMAALEQEA